MNSKEMHPRREQLHDTYHEAVMPGAGWVWTFHGSHVFIIIAAGTGICLRAVKMLVLDFDRASRASKVGKLLEADAWLHLDSSTF